MAKYDISHFIFHPRTEKKLWFRKMFLRVIIDNMFIEKISTAMGRLGSNPLFTYDMLGRVPNYFAN